MSDRVKEGQNHWGLPVGNMELNSCLPRTKLFLICSLKGCCAFQQCNSIPAHFSQMMTELPLGNGLAIGIQLAVWEAGGS